MEELTSGGIKLSQIENSLEYKKIIKNMLCCICLGVVCKPVECVICHTLICEDCFQILTIAGKQCMTSNCKGNLKKANKFVREILTNLKIKCQFCDKKGMPYHEYISHIDKCELYQSSEQVKLLKEIREKDDKINEMTKEVESERSSKKINSSFSKKKDPYAHLSKEALRTSLMSFNLNSQNKMDLYTACVEGKLEEFKNLILNKKFPVLEEVSARNYFWSPFHYAMHYGQWEIINFIVEHLRQANKFESALRLESNDKRCPILCLLRSNSLDMEKKTEILKKFLKANPDISLSDDVKKELKARNLESVVKTLAPKLLI